jgi:hypothetical protein
LPLVYWFVNLFKCLLSNCCLTGIGPGSKYGKLLKSLGQQLTNCSSSPTSAMYQLCDFEQSDFVTCLSLSFLICETL